MVFPFFGSELSACKPRERKSDSDVEEYLVREAGRSKRSAFSRFAEQHNRNFLISLLRHRSQQERQFDNLNTLRRILRERLRLQTVNANYQLRAGPEEYNLALQWPQSACAVFGSCPVSSFVPKESWTLHGLWPRKTCSGTSPGFKEWDDLARKDESLIRQINSLWPDIKAGEQLKDTVKNTFVKHEWDKHGSCNGFGTFKEYAEKSLALAKKFNPFPVLESAEMEPSSSPVDFNTFFAKLETGMSKLSPRIASSQFLLVCAPGKSGDQYAMEIRICLDQKEQPTTCKRSGTKDCTATSIYYPKRKWLEKQFTIPAPRNNSTYPSPLSSIWLAPARPLC